MKKLFFGIDGGGTKSRLAVSDDTGKVICTVSGFSTNMYAVGFEQACVHILSLFDILKEKQGICVSDFTEGCFASAGLSVEKEKALFKQFFKDNGISCPVYLCNDALAALAGGTGKAEGLILISGTGSIAAALRADGKTARAGGLGHLIGDEGSGFRIGLDGIRSAVCAYERRAQKTVLTEHMFEHYKVSDVRDLFSFLYTNFDKARIASFAPLVFQSAGDGDGAAVAILEQALIDLTDLVKSAYIQIFETEKTDLVFSGGIFEHEADFSRRTAERIRSALPQITVQERLYDPATGACILARSHLA
ncbi:ATPase [Treponema sp. OMZ 840]|uniref:N-acetylglucosamine kinase n=1 Tax=Treponema sp. OMZ 840 TaxID=244313 RepID=UPI003D8E1A3A